MGYLSELSVKNFATIEDANLDLGPGLNIITGETGAGKSLLIGALGLVSGNRSLKHQVRAGHDKAEVRAKFIISESDFELLSSFSNHKFLGNSNSPIIFKRVINVDSKLSFCTINDKVCSLKLLQTLTSQWLKIYSQNSQAKLVNREFKFNVLDEFAGTNNQVNTFQSYFSHLMILRKELANLNGKISEIEAKKEFLEFQIQDIQTAELKVGEEELLNDELEMINHSESIFNACADAHNKLYEESGCAVDKIAISIKMIDKIPDPGNVFQKQIQLLDKALELVREASQSIRNYGQSVQRIPKKEEQISDRLLLIGHLMRKYGGTVEEVIKNCELAESSLQDLEDCRSKREDVIRLLAQAENQAGLVARELSGQRIKASKALDLIITNKLKELAMEDAKFSIHINQHEPNYGVPISTNSTYSFNDRGIDNVHFLIGTGDCEVLRPIDESLSGGEASRLILALSVALSKYSNQQTMVFDEVDSGVGGRIGDLIGRGLWELAQEGQVLCITHLPQVAVFADRHIQVSKQTISQKASTVIQTLKENEKATEIAEMLGDSESAIILDAAERLLEQSRGSKLAYSALKEDAKKYSTAGLLIPD